MPPRVPAITRLECRLHHLPQQLVAATRVRRRCLASGLFLRLCLLLHLRYIYIHIYVDVYLCIHIDIDIDIGIDIDIYLYR